MKFWDREQLSNLTQVATDPGLERPGSEPLANRPRGRKQFKSSARTISPEEVANCSPGTLWVGVVQGPGQAELSRNKMRITKRFGACCGFVALAATLLAINASRDSVIAPTIAAPLPAPKSENIAPDSVTLDNFVSLEMSTSGGFANLTSRLQIGDEGEASWTANRRVGAGAAPLRLTLALHDYSALLRVLNTARFPTLAGRYTQRNLADGINETVTLTLRGANGELQTFAVQNYGENAPPGFYAVTTHLRQLIQRKPASVAVRAQTAINAGEITRENLQLLTISISSGDDTASGNSSITQYKVSGNTLTLRSGRQQVATPIRGMVQLSDKEMNDILLLLNADITHAREAQQVQMPIVKTSTLPWRGHAPPPDFGRTRFWTTVAIEVTWRRDGTVQTFTRNYGSSGPLAADYVSKLMGSKRNTAPKPQ